MTDKEKIRAEIERLYNEVKGSEKESNIDTFYKLQYLLNFIDSLSEEPVSKNMETDIVIRLGGVCHKQVWHKNHFSKEDCKAYCSLYKECQECSIDLCMIFFHDPHCYFEEEPVSEDLEEAAKRYAIESYPDKPSIGQFGTGDYEPYVDMSGQRECAVEDFKAGAKWQMHKDVEKKTIVNKS